MDKEAENEITSEEDTVEQPGKGVFLPFFYIIFIFQHKFPYSISDDFL